MFSSTRATYSAKCPIKGPSGLKEPHCREDVRRRRLQFECQQVNIMLLSFCGAAGKLSARVTVGLGS
jgi:hypothetical protein